MKTITKNDAVYIAGPMSGHADNNYPSFHFAEEHLVMKFGCEILNPARHPDGLAYVTYMRMAMEMIERATVLVMLPGYNHSTGATIELTVARKSGIQVFLFNVPELIKMEQ